MGQTQFGYKVRGLGVVGSALSLAVGASLLLGGAAYAAATVQAYDTGPIPFTVKLPVDGTCGGGTGTILLTGTEQVSGQFVFTANGVSFHGTDTGNLRIDLPADSAYGPGAYILDSPVGHFAFVVYGPVSTYILAGNDTPIPIYSASGQRVGLESVQIEERVTALDLGAPGPSPEDKVVVEFERFSDVCLK